MGVWTETRTGSWSYDPNGRDDDQPATTALPVIYPATHVPTPPAPSGWETDDGTWYARVDPAEFPDFDNVDSTRADLGAPA